MYGNGAAELLEGCSCGAKVFFFIKQSKLEESRRITEQLTVQEKKRIERDVLDLVGVNKKSKHEAPVILDFESIRVHKPGSYELDLVNLFKKQPLIYRLGEGKYVMDLPESFRQAAKGKKGKR